MAFYYGASGIGIGKSIIKYNKVDRMVQKINLLKQGVLSHCHNIKNINHILIPDILKKNIIYHGTALR